MDETTTSPSPPLYLHPLPPPPSTPTLFYFLPPRIIFRDEYYPGCICLPAYRVQPTMGVARAVHLASVGHLKMFKALWALNTLIN